MRRILLAGVLMGTLHATTALTADEILGPVAAAPAAYDWTGVYVGGTLGYGWGNYNGFAPNGFGPNVDVNNFLYGGVLGYNWQRNNLVFGVEADIQNGPDGTTAQGTPIPPGGAWQCGTGACNTDINYWGSVRGRVGVAHNQWLIYGTGGFAYGGYDGGIFNSVQQGSGTASGWTAGAGVEWGYQNWSARLEYLHVDLGDLTFGTAVGGAFQGSGDFDVLRMGVTYRFNLHNQ